MADHRRTFITAFTATIGVAAAGGCLALIGTAGAVAKRIPHAWRIASSPDSGFCRMRNCQRTLNVRVHNFIEMMKIDHEPPAGIF